jgi:hypothetical protein
MNKEINNKQLIIVSIGVFLLLTGIVLLFIWKNGSDTSKDGTLGDAFNGLLAPFISAAGAILVSLSFRAQIRANIIITSQWHFDLLLKSLNDVKLNYDGITLHIKSDHRREDDPPYFRGIEAVSALGKGPLQPFKKYENTIVDFHTVILEFCYVVNQILKAQIDDKSYLHLRASTFYARNLEAQSTQIRDLILNNNLADKLPAVIPDINSLQAKIFDLRTDGTWGNLL